MPASVKFHGGQGGHRNPYGDLTLCSACPAATSRKLKHLDKPLAS
jgi:hypothetical protein